METPDEGSPVRRVLPERAPLDGGRDPETAVEELDALDLRPLDGDAGADEVVELHERVHDRRPLGLDDAGEDLGAGDRGDGEEVVRGHGSKSFSASLLTRERSKSSYEDDLLRPLPFRGEEGRLLVVAEEVVPPVDDAGGAGETPVVHAEDEVPLLRQSGDLHLDLVPLHEEGRDLVRDDLRLVRLLLLLLGLPVLDLPHADQVEEVGLIGLREERVFVVLADLGQVLVEARPDLRPVPRGARLLRGVARLPVHARRLGGVPLLRPELVDVADVHLSSF